MKLQNFLKKTLQLMTNSNMDHLLHMFHHEQVFFKILNPYVPPINHHSPISSAFL